MSWITGTGLTPFGKHPGRDTLDLMSTAAEAALADAGLERREVDGLLAELESVRGDKIVVESLRPDPVGRKVEITATAPAFGDITEFIDWVNASKALHQAFLVSETAAREPGIRFVATATWRETE